MLLERAIPRIDLGWLAGVRQSPAMPREELREIGIRHDVLKSEPGKIGAPAFRVIEREQAMPVAEPRVEPCGG